MSYAHARLIYYRMRDAYCRMERQETVANARRLTQCVRRWQSISTPTKQACGVLG